MLQLIELLSVLGDKVDGPISGKENVAANIADKELISAAGMQWTFI